MDKEEDNQNQITSGAAELPYHGGVVHLVLFHSYAIFLLAVVLGVILDMIIPINVWNGDIHRPIGLVMIILGSLIIYWAQSASSFTRNQMEKTGVIRKFAHGPYKYSRNPTHFGLLVMTLGLGLVLNSAFTIVLTILAYITTKLIFVKEEEVLLQKKYGQDYSDYKKKVSTWL